MASEDGTEVYAFDTEGRHISTRNALTAATKYAFDYDGAGRLAAITDANGLVTQIERDAESGQATAVVAPNGQRTELTVNADGYLEGIDEPGGIHRGFTYGSGEAAGLLASYQNPRGNTSSFTYDELGRVTGESMPGGCSWTIQRLTGPSATSPQTPVKVSVTSAEGRTRSYQLGSDASNLEVRPMVSTAGLTTQSTTSRAGVETTSTPDGMVTTVTTGADAQFGLQTPIAASTVVRTPAGKQMSVASSNSVTLDAARNLVSRVDTTSVNGKASTTTYNAAARTQTTVSPMGRQTVTTLDAQGRVVRVQAGNLEPTAYSYDARGRLATVTVGTGASARVTTFGYDPLDRLATVTDPLNRTQSYGYDDANRVTTQTFTDGNSVLFSYDANGNVTSVTPPSRPAHAFGFTPADLMSSYTPPVVGSETPTTYEYNLDKQPTVIHRPDGSQIVFTYDGAGRLATTTYPKGPEASDGTITVTRSYNPTTGKLASVSTSDGQGVSYGYDGNLVTSVTAAGTAPGVVSMTYNNDFRPATQTVAGNTVSLGYDNDGLASQMGSLSIARYATNGLVSSTSMNTVADTVQYTTFGELQSLETKHAGTSIFGQAFIQDSAGRIEQKTESIQGATTVWNYSYDSAGRLWQVMQNGVLVATYLYDANGNRTSVATPSGTQTATYDSQDRLLTYGKWTYAYTPNGDLQSKTDTTSGASTTYAYDGLGNLRRVGLPDGRVVEYVIDGNARRVAKKVNGTVVRRWLYEGQLTPVAELDGNGTLVNRFVSSEYLVRGSSTYRIVKDHLGSPRLIVDVATGAIGQRLDLDEWGRLLNDTSPGFQVLGFGGGIHDPDTGLVRFGARDYDPETGRWTAKDPMGFAGGSANPFVYVNGDPINCVDPTGLEAALPLPNPTPIPRVIPLGPQQHPLLCSFLLGVWIGIKLEPAVASYVDAAVEAVAGPPGGNVIDLPLPQPADTCSECDQPNNPDEPGCYQKYIAEVHECGTRFYSTDPNYKRCLDNAAKNRIRCLNHLPPKPFKG